MNHPLLLLSPLGAGLLGAIVVDLKTRRVPNAISGFVLVSGLGVNAYVNGARGVGSGLAAAVIVLLALFVPWRARGLGGGDVKLAAATGAWIGLSKLVWFGLTPAVAGGVVAAIGLAFVSPQVRADVKANLVLAAVHGDLPPEAASHRKSNVSIPYAVAISAGAAVALLIA